MSSNALRGIYFRCNNSLSSHKNPRKAIMQAALLTTESSTVVSQNVFKYPSTNSITMI